MQFDSLSLIHDLRGCDLTLTSGSTFTLTFTKQNVYRSTRFDERITMVPAFWLYGHFWRRCEPTTKPRPLGHWPDLWGHRLTWELKFGHKSLRLVKADITAFPRSSSSIRGETARRSCQPISFDRAVCRKPLRLASVKGNCSPSEKTYFLNIFK